MKMTNALFDTLEELIFDSSEIIKPIEDISVSQCAANHRKLNNPGSYVGDWPNEKTPYLVEPMDELNSLEYTGMIFVGPSRTGKSDMLFNWLTYTALYDNADIMAILMTQNVARDWSKKDLARFFRATSEVGEKVLPGNHNKNVHDIKFRGNWDLLIKWPTITELSGKTIQRLWLADYDRMSDDIDGEGNAFDLASKRSQTYKKHGMCVAESSPGREVTDINARLATPHYAPPTTGILDLYNRGDRRRWFWRCLSCKQAFEPKFECLNYPDSKDFVEASEMVTMKCPRHDCGFDMMPEYKDEMNQIGRWVKDGQYLDETGVVHGKGPRTDIASFWMFGPSAAFQSWKSLVYNYLVAMRSYNTTGDTGPLKKTLNTDQGVPFAAPGMNKNRSPDWMEDRKVDFGGSQDDPVVPPGVLFLIATVDVQAGQRSGFVVQVHGVHTNYDVTFIDMFRIRESARPGSDGTMLPCDPAAYPEDWRLLVSKVITRTYPLSDDSGRRMAILKTGCDMGGAEGVATNAYGFYRTLRDDRGKEFPYDIARRFQLVRGEPTKGAPRARLSYPDAGRKDRNSGARGDVPVLSLHSNTLKDQIDSMLNRRIEGGGFVRFPHWAPNWLYSQLTGERRTDKGWVNTRRVKNEAWDLFYYCIGLLLHPDIDYENINWDRPPKYALDWDKNELVFKEGDSSPFEKKRKLTYDLGEFARDLG